MQILKRILDQQQLFISNIEKERTSLVARHVVDMETYLVFVLTPFDLSKFSVCPGFQSEYEGSRKGFVFGVVCCFDFRVFFPPFIRALHAVSSQPSPFFLATTFIISVLLWSWLFCFQEEDRCRLPETETTFGGFKAQGCKKKTQKMKWRNGKILLDPMIIQVFLFIYLHHMILRTRRRNRILCL